MRKILMLFIALACMLSLVACSTNGKGTQADTNKTEYDLPSACHYMESHDFLATSTTSYKLGDVDKNGDITTADILKLYQYIYNSTTFPLDDGTDPSPFTLGDVNKDGKISNKDILLFYKYIFNPDLYPLEEQTEEESTDSWMGPGIWM